MNIVKNILDVAAEHNYTNKKICELLKKNGSYVSDWKSGKSKPKADELLILAKEFGVSVDYLLGNTPPQTVNTGDITNNSGIIGQTNAPVTINGKERILTTQEQDLLRIYNAADGKTQMKIMNYVYDIEENL